MHSGTLVLLYCKRKVLYCFYSWRSTSKHLAQSSTLKNRKQFMLCCLLFALRSSCLRPLSTCWLLCIFPLTLSGQLLQPQWREKNNEEEDKLVSLPPSLCRNFLPLIFSFFSITKDSFHCCQLNESLCILHPIPTHHSVFSLSLAGDVSSSSFFFPLHSAF